MTFGKGFIDQIGQRYTGISIFPEMSGAKGFNLAPVFETYTGLIAGVVGSKLATGFGINKYTKRIPIVGKWVKL
jgi:hypothetical protein